MTELSTELHGTDTPKSCLEAIREALKERPLRSRLLLVLTLNKNNPNFDLLDDGLKARTNKSAAEAITGIGLYVAHFAVLFIEGAAENVMDCIRWLEGLRCTDKETIKEGHLLFFSDYRTYKLTPTFWSHRPKDFLDMQFEEGENELNEDNVSEQAFAVYEKMVLLAHKLKETNMEAQLDPTGLLSRDFIRFTPDPRMLHSLLSAQKTKDLLFSLKEFHDNFLGDFYTTLSEDAFL